MVEPPKQEQQLLLTRWEENSSDQWFHLVVARSLGVMCSKEETRSAWVQHWYSLHNYFKQFSHQVFNHLFYLFHLNKDFKHIKIWHFNFFKENLLWNLDVGSPSCSSPKCPAGKLNFSLLVFCALYINMLCTLTKKLFCATLQSQHWLCKTKASDPFRTARSPVAAGVRAAAGSQRSHHGLQSRVISLTRRALIPALQGPPLQNGIWQSEVSWFQASLPGGKIYNLRGESPTQGAESVKMPSELLIESNFLRASSWSSNVWHQRLSASEVIYTSDTFPLFRPPKCWVVLNFEFWALVVPGVFCSWGTMKLKSASWLQSHRDLSGGADGENVDCLFGLKLMECTNSLLVNRRKTALNPSLGRRPVVHFNKIDQGATRLPCGKSQCRYKIGLGCKPPTFRQSDGWMDYLFNGDVFHFNTVVLCDVASQD